MDWQFYTKIKEKNWSNKKALQIGDQGRIIHEISRSFFFLNVQTTRTSVNESSQLSTMTESICTRLLSVSCRQIETRVTRRPANSFLIQSAIPLNFASNCLICPNVKVKAIIKKKRCRISRWMNFFLPRCVNDSYHVGHTIRYWAVAGAVAVAGNFSSHGHIPRREHLALFLFLLFFSLP